jgi:pimeloyl-ACP methyl ester carboxylesterase
MADTWGPALLGGVELAAGARDVLPASDLDFVAYGDVFRPAGRFLDGGVPPFTADDVDPRLEAELLLAWWRAAADSDPQVTAPDGRSLGAAASVRAAVLALAGARFLARVSERVLVFWLKQVSAYFTQPQVRAQIQERFAAAIGPETRVVVAHSLGSVVAYEALCAHPQWPVTDFVTVGSPLAVPHIVTDRLRPPPGPVEPAVARWVNITDDGDFVALQPKLRRVFGDRVTDVGISNGIKAHEVHRYLSAAETGTAVLAGLR